MNLFEIVDRILHRPEEETQSGDSDPLLGLPARLTGIDLKPLRDLVDTHRSDLEHKLGRGVHPSVALLDLADTDPGPHPAIDDYCLLKKSALLDLISAAVYDNLTGLYSRNILETRLQEEFQRARRYDIPLSILFIETDEFKLYNDTYGHIEGDKVLSFIGKFIQSHVREVDFAARYGGDEFLIILPHTGGETALGMARRIHANLSEAQRDVGLRSEVTISIGVGMLTHKMESAESLTEAADRASYKAKVNKNMVWPTINADPQDDLEAPAQA
jgi:diguanylate cyclase (GGDEF)-like protein